MTGEARRHAEAARAGGLNQRRLWLQLAEIEEAEGGDTEAGRTAQRDALRRAAAAEPDPVWSCAVCHTPQAAWHPACPVCGAPGALRWGSVAPIVTPRLLTAVPDRPAEVVVRESSLSDQPPRAA